MPAILRITLSTLVIRLKNNPTLLAVKANKYVKRMTGNPVPNAKTMGK